MDTHMSISQAHTDIVPSEILSEVFTRYTRNGIWSSAPITLGLVCTRWRRITLSTPRLWESVKLKGYGDQLFQHIPAINEWLSRSLNLPCDLKATVKGEDQPGIIPHILRPISSRVRNLALRLELDELAQCVEVFQLEFPLLQNLRLSLIDEASSLFPSVLSGYTLPLNFSTYPRLHRISLSVGIICVLPEDLAEVLPYSLKYYADQHGIRANGILGLLDKCRKLKKLYIEEGGPIHDPLPEDLGFQFSHMALRTFHLEYRNSGVASLFRAVRFPSLVDLSLAYIPDPNGILTHIADASPPLENFELFKVNVQTDEILPLLQRTNTIRRLKLRYRNVVDDAFVSALTLSTGQFLNYLPHLEYFGVGDDDAGKVNDTDAGLVALIESRWRVKVEEVDRIKAVSVYDDRLLEEWSDRLSVMKSEGLECFVHGPGLRARDYIVISDGE